MWNVIFDTFAGVCDDVGRGMNSSAVSEVTQPAAWLSTINDNSN